MTESKSGAGLYFFGPRADAEGGIATVLRNYRRTAFWSDFRCRHLPTMRDFRRQLPKAAFEVYRIVASLIILTAGPRPGAVSIHSACGSSFYRKLCYLLVARLFRIPAVLHIHPASFADFYRDGRAFRKGAIRLASRLSDQVVFLAEQTRQELGEVFPLTKARVLPNPVDVAEFVGPQDHAGRSPAHILFLGWIIREKGVYDLVDAMPEVLRHYPLAKFTFAGNKDVEELRGLLESRGLAASAEVPGWVDGERRLRLLQSATALVLPSYAEGLPNVILEAMASRLPIVTTPVGAIPSVLQHGVTALFVSPGDATGIAGAILTLLRDGSLRERMAGTAFEKVRTQYSLEAVSHGLTAIYSRYLGATTASASPRAPGIDHPLQ